MAYQKCLRLPISFATVEIAARQGLSKMLNARYAIAAMLVGKKAWNAVCIAGSYSSMAPSWVSWAMVDTRPSFATKPDRVAATGRQSPKPRGIKMGAMKPAMAAIREFSGSTRPNAPPYIHNSLLQCSLAMNLHNLGSLSYIDVSKCLHLSPPSIYIAAFRDGLTIILLAISSVIARRAPF